MSEEQEQQPQKTPQSLIKERHVLAALTADKGPQAQLLSWQVKDFTNKGDNYASVVTSVCVTYTNEGHQNTVTYVVKCNPCRIMKNSDKLNAVVFEKEARFYTDIMPLLNAELEAAGQEPLKTASCFHVDLSPGEEVILLGDLRPEGFKMVDRRKGLDKSHTCLVLRELARLHSASVLVQDKNFEDLVDKFPFLKIDFVDIFDMMGEGMLQTAFKGNIDNVSGMMRDIAGYEKVIPWLTDLSSRVVEEFNAMLKRRGPFTVLCHGDCWNNNFLFKYDEGGQVVDVRLLDLQICRYASPGTDLNYLLYTSLNGPDRKENLQHFLKTYHDSFCRVLDLASRTVPFTLDQLRQEFHQRNMLGLLMGMMAVPAVVAEEKHVVDMDTVKDVEEMMRGFQGKGTDLMKTNPLIRPRLLAIFDDMIEFGVIKI